MALAILETLARRLRHFAEMVSDPVFRPRLGTVRELVARAFLQLEQSGVVTRKRKRVVIRDAARLAGLARGEPYPPGRL